MARLSSGQGCADGAAPRPGRRRFLAAAGSAAVLAGCAGPGGFAPFFGQRESGFADVNGTRLYYEVAGSGAPVVLLHAFTLDTRMWDAQFDSLAARYRVIRYDARGFGRSALPRTSERYSPADDLHALLAHLGATRPHLVGHAMGGRFAIDFALTYPEELGHLILVDTVVGGWAWSEAVLAGYRPVLEAGKRGDIPAAKQAWLGAPLFATARENPAIAQELGRMVGDYSGWHFVNADPARSPSPAAVQQLGKITAPTLALVGERDLADFHSIADRIAADVPKARKRIVPGAGHLSTMEAPAAVTRELLAFLPHT